MRAISVCAAAVWAATLIFSGPSVCASTALAGGQVSSSGTGGFCSPSGLGAPCAIGGTAAIGNTEPVPSLGIGNPVHLASGNKYQLEIDLPPNASAPGLELIRHYNGLSIRSGALGRNWTLSYDTQLVHRGKRWWLRQGDGSVRPIIAPVPSGAGMLLAMPGGRQLHFDANGLLIRIRAAAVTLARIDRHEGPGPLLGLIKRVESASGYALEFHYAHRQGQAVLTAVDTPLGRFRYDYGTPDPATGHVSPRLETVTRPDGMQRVYHYESSRSSGNLYSLTGLSVNAPGGPPRRLASWEYDREGRVVVLQQHGRPTPVVHLDYLHNGIDDIGMTRVRSSNGRERLLRFQRVGGEYRPLGSGSDAPDTSAAVEYDSAGRLVAISGLQLQRGTAGGVKGMTPQAPGWPGLGFEIDRQGDHRTWRSDATGATTVMQQGRGQTVLLHYADGGYVELLQDAQGRPIRLQHTAADPALTSITHLQWRGRNLQRIVHPHETETRVHDASGRLARRALHRPAWPGSAATSFREAFEYDGHGRLRRHDLPEGGALIYQWEQRSDRAPRLVALHWQDATGRQHPVITSITGRPGYRYGNGLKLFTGIRNGQHADVLELLDGDQLIWRETRRYDAAGHIQENRHDFPAVGHHDAMHLVHDSESRMVGASHAAGEAPTLGWYAWYPDGRLAATRQNQRSEIPQLSHNASGLPLEVAGYRLRYGPTRRLEAVSPFDGGPPVAQYHHNAFGHRILKLTADATTHYLYLHDRLVAEARSPNGDAAPRVVRRYLYAGLAPVGMIEYPPDRPARLYAVHADLSGAPRLLTDSSRRLRWLASYSPTGAAHRVAGDLHFPLRFPGQYEDPETGWHDNLLRTYAPELGQFLEPDPLGPLPDTDTYGYARQQVWRYADPHGLLLFAFDGTRYSAENMSNAWVLAQHYRDGAAHYHTGPGNSLFLDWDAIVAWRAGRILENQWQALLSTLQHQPAGTTMPIDIIGFSRGAALARHFGNRIAAQVNGGLFSVDDPMRGRVSACVDLRFMGLFDTVAQFGVGGSHNHLYDFGVSELWAWVAHAVAMHEHRWTFPLTSADAGGAGNVVEAPFIGAHADIGGGLALLAPPAAEPREGAPDSVAMDSDLAKVALGWMHWQAQAASVDFEDLAATQALATTPVMHDMRGVLARSVQRGDRAILTPSGNTRSTYQDDDPRLGAAARSQVEAFILRQPGWRSQPGSNVGTVDMEGYSRWLQETLGWEPPRGP